MSRCVVSTNLLSKSVINNLIISKSPAYNVIQQVNFYLFFFFDFIQKAQRFSINELSKVLCNCRLFCGKILPVLHIIKRVRDEDTS